MLYRSAVSWSSTASRFTLNCQHAGFQECRPSHPRLQKWSSNFSKGVYIWANKYLPPMFCFRFTITITHLSLLSFKQLHKSDFLLRSTPREIAQSRALRLVGTRLVAIVIVISCSGGGKTASTLAPASAEEWRTQRTKYQMAVGVFPRQAELSSLVV